MLSEPETVLFGLPESVTITVMFEVPGAVGVPPTVHPVSERPAGNVPDVIEQLYGVVPPLVSIVALYTTPTVPLGKEFVIVRAAGLITMVSGPDVVCVGEPESVTLTVTVELPAVVGVPLTVHPLMLSPAGSVPDVMLQLYGDVPPLTPMVAL
jgi:hypothetical protein